MKPRFLEPGVIQYRASSLVCMHKAPHSFIIGHPFRMQRGLISVIKKKIQSLLCEVEASVAFSPLPFK